MPALCQEIMQGIKTLLSFSSALQDIPPKDLLIGLVSHDLSLCQSLESGHSEPTPSQGILYLSAEQRKALRDAPEENRHLASQLGKPVPPELLEALISMALIGRLGSKHFVCFMLGAVCAACLSAQRILRAVS